MSHFYISVIIIGLVLIIASLVWVIYDKKKSVGYVYEMEEKKAELENTIEDAEEMIMEMNKFYDYIVTQIDSRNKQLKSKINEFNKETGNKNTVNNIEENETEDKVIDRSKNKGTKIAGYKAEVVLENEVENTKVVKPDRKEEYNVDYKVANELEVEEDRSKYKNSHENNVYTIKDLIKNATKYTAQNSMENSVQDTIPLNPKQIEVLKLATEGLNETEIAKKMNIGKGEVQLILGLNR